MLEKLVILNIKSVQKPLKLTIFWDDNVKKEIVCKKKTKFCICLKGDFVRLVAKYNNQTYLKTIYLKNFRCQNVFVNFMFNTTISQKTSGIITLTDLIYGFPVKKALLNFKQK